MVLPVPIRNRLLVRESRLGERRLMPPELMRIAASQDGLVTCDQVLGAAVGAQTLKSWVRRGRLRTVHRGVYLVRARS